MKKADVLAAFNLLKDRYPDGVTIPQVQDLFPPQDAIKVKSHIKRLFSQGYLQRLKNPHQRRSHIYFLPLKAESTQGEMWPASEHPEPTPQSPPLANKRKALAIACEVCGALIGLRMADTLYLVECPSCKANYVFKSGLCHRLNPGIKPDVWTISS